MERNIEDNKHNYTRFLVISKNITPKTGTDKTSIMFSIKDKPGALYDILQPIKKAKINLTKLRIKAFTEKGLEYYSLWIWKDI